MKKDLRNLYQKLRSESKNFQDMKATYIIEEPRYLKIIRLLLNLDQRNFAKLLETNQSRISLFERGSIKPNQKEAEKYAKISSKARLPKLKFIELEVRAEEISQRGKFEGEYAKKMAERSVGKASIISAQRKKPTEQEVEIINFLERKGILFERNPLTDLGVLKFVSDFAIPNSKQPKILIEAKRLLTIYRKKQIICELGYKSIKIKQKFPKVKFVAIVDGKLTNTEKYILKEECDQVLETKELEKLAVDSEFVR